MSNQQQIQRDAARQAAAEWFRESNANVPAAEIDRLANVIKRSAATAITTNRWYVSAMNDALFIIDKQPSPSGTDHQFFDSPPTSLVIALGAGDKRTQELAQRIVDAHNADLAPVVQ